MSFIYFFADVLPFSLINVHRSKQVPSLFILHKNLPPYLATIGVPIIWHYLLIAFINIKWNVLFSVLPTQMYKWPINMWKSVQRVSSPGMWKLKWHSIFSQNVNQQENRWDTCWWECGIWCWWRENAIVHINVQIPQKHWK